MHQIALQSIQVRKISPGKGGGGGGGGGAPPPPPPPARSGLRPSILSLVEKFMLVETSHTNCWIHP